MFLDEFLSDNRDVDRATNSFLRQFNSMYYNFYFCNLSVKSYLFKSYMSSFYGIKTWSGVKLKELYKIGVTYRKAVKRIAGLKPWDRNHIACDIVHVPIFKHMLVKRFLGLFFRLCTFASPCIYFLRSYFKFRSNLRNNLSNWFEKYYNVGLNNTLSALMSRIDFIQSHEQSGIFSV